MPEFLSPPNGQQGSKAYQLIPYCPVRMSSAIRRARRQRLDESAYRVDDLVVRPTRLRLPAPGVAHEAAEAPKHGPAFADLLLVA